MSGRTALQSWEKKGELDLRPQEARFSHTNKDTADKKLTEVPGPSRGKGSAAKGQEHDGDAVTGTHNLGDHGGSGSEYDKGNLVVCEDLVELHAVKAQVLLDAGCVGIGEVASIERAVGMTISRKELGIGA